VRENALAASSICDQQWRENRRNAAMKHQNGDQRRNQMTWRRRGEKSRRIGEINGGVVRAEKKSGGGSSAQHRRRKSIGEQWHQ